jgi:hypothetical protein
MAVTCRIHLEHVSVDSIRTFVTSIQTAMLILIFQYLHTQRRQIKKTICKASDIQCKMSNRRT